jgi:hypothetical protein
MALSALRWFKAALVLQALLVAYCLATQVLDLFPWNDISAGTGDLRETIALTVLPQMALIALFALGVRLLALLSLAGYVLYLGLQIWTWWHPWVVGATAEWQAEHQASFSRTLKLVPFDAVHIAPDAQHLVLQALILATVVATAMAVARMEHL